MPPFGISNSTPKSKTMLDEIARSNKANENKQVHFYHDEFHLG